MMRSRKTAPREAGRGFRLALASAGASNLGDGLAAMALPWLASTLTDDAVWIGAIGFAHRAPWLLLTLPFGALTDRIDRRRAMIFADGARALAALGLVALAASRAESAIALLALAAFALGGAEVLRDNAAQTLLPSIVDKVALERANGRLWAIESVMGSFLGPPMAGLLVAHSLGAPFAVQAACFALAAALVASIEAPPRAAAARRALLEEIAEGWAWMRARAMLLRLAIVLGLINAVAMMGSAMLVLFAREILGLDGFGYGLLATAGAAGGVAGGIWGPRLVARWGANASMRVALATMPLPFLAIAVTNNVAVVAIALFVEMFAALTWNIVTVSWRQRLIPDHLLGRVNSLYRWFGWGLTPIGALAGGVLIDLAEPGLGRGMALRLPYAVAALACLGLFLYGRRALDLER